MGAVFQVLPAQNLPDQRLPLQGIRVPARLNGGLAGHGVQDVIPQTVPVLPLSLLQVLDQAGEAIRRLLRGEVHGSLAQQHRSLPKFFHAIPQFIQQGQLLQHQRRTLLTQTAHLRGQQGLRGNLLLLGPELVKQNPLVGGVLVDEERLLPLLYHDVGAEQLPQHRERGLLRHGQHRLDRLRLFLRRRRDRSRL